MCAFRDDYTKFKEAGAEVFGMSSDDVSANSKFATVLAQDLESLVANANMASCVLFSLHKFLEVCAETDVLVERLYLLLSSSGHISGPHAALPAAQ